MRRNIKNGSREARHVNTFYGKNRRKRLILIRDRNGSQPNIQSTVVRYERQGFKRDVDLVRMIEFGCRWGLQFHRITQI
jgi:hypothetical protein